MGIDFAGAAVTAAELRTCARAVLATGTAALLATLVSSSMDTYRRNLPMLADLREDPAFRGRVLGIHLEGPFLPSDDRVLGAHRRDQVRAASVAAFDELNALARGHVRLLTLAAELPGAPDLIRHATASGVRVCVGHSYYSSTQLDHAGEAGARMITHLGNALPVALDKRDNPFSVGLLADGLWASFIADGHHLSRQMLELLFRCKTAARLVAVSDAAPVAGLPPGRYRVLGQPARLDPDGRLYNEQESHLVGSTVNLVDCLNHLLRQRICTAAEAALVGSGNPLRLLGLTAAALDPGSPRVRYDRATGQLVLARG